jgi:hypothetical protein
MKIVSIVLAYVALAAGATAAISMLYRMGRPGDKPRPALLWVHRVAGYLFVAFMTFLFAGMLYKITVYGKGLTPGVAWHGAAGFAVMAFIFFKWAVVRPFRGLLKLAPALGITVLALAFVVVNLGATMDLLDWLGARREAATPLAGGTERLEVAPSEEMRAMHEEMLERMSPGGGEEDRLHAARVIFAEKCGRCHHLRRSFETPRPPEQWPPLIERMRSYDVEWISDADAAEIEFYLKGDYGPGR